MVLCHVTDSTFFPENRAHARRRMVEKMVSKTPICFFFQVPRFCRGAEKPVVVSVGQVDVSGRKNFFRKNGGRPEARSPEKKTVDRRRIYCFFVLVFGGWGTPGKSGWSGRSDYFFRMGGQN